MDCPREITEILTEILTTGLLRIRAMAWTGNPERCAIEADHLHNLPSLLADFRPELLDYYWRAERVAFVKRSKPDDVAVFEPLWQALATRVASAQDEAIPTG